MSVTQAPDRATLLVEDPDLGAALGEDVLRQARELLVVPARWIEAGPWDGAELRHEPSLGLLVLEGLMTVDVRLGDRVASDLVGAGDVLHATSAAETLVPAAFSYHANERTRVAVLDVHFIAAARRWPGLLLALHERVRLQHRRHAITGAIAKLPRVEDRVHALLWHLAERWGRMTAEGVLLPLALTHESLGRLVGAARPTVSLGLIELEERGAVSRRSGGGFLLAGRSWETMPAKHVARASARPLTVVRTEEAVAEEGEDDARRPVLLDIAAVRRRIAALNADLPERTRDIEARLATAKARAEASGALRARIQAERHERRGG